MSNLFLIKISVVIGLSAFILFFSSCENKKRYPVLEKNRTVLRGDPGKWDENSVHTLSIVEVNKEGFKYWAYYGLNHYEDSAITKKAGLVRSNDLIHWEKYAGNPVIESNCRWPTAVYKDGIFHLFYAEYLPGMDSRIVYVSSEDGYTFQNKKVIVPYEKGLQNQNPFIYYNQQDQSFYLFYYHGRERGKKDKKWSIYVKKASTLQGLAKTQPKEIMSEPFIIAAPSVINYNNRYYLLIESLRPGQWDDKWVTLAYESSHIDHGFSKVENNPVLLNNDACAFQYIFNGQLYVYYSHLVDQEKDIWELRMTRGIN